MSRSPLPLPADLPALHRGEAEGRRWHENRFCCQDCAGPWGGGRDAPPGGGPAVPAALRVAIGMPAGAWPPLWEEGRPSVREERCGSKGKWAAAGAGQREFSRAGALAPVPRRPVPPAAPPSSNRTPKPELRGPQLSPRIPGRSAPRASRAHPAPRVRLRRGTPSRTGDVPPPGGRSGEGRGAREDRAEACAPRGRGGRLGLASCGPPRRGLGV